jgi:hypothetical protein
MLTFFREKIANIIVRFLLFPFNFSFFSQVTKIHTYFSLVHTLDSILIALLVSFKVHNALHGFLPPSKGSKQNLVQQIPIPAS